MFRVVYGTFIFFVLVPSFHCLSSSGKLIYASSNTRRHYPLIISKFNVLQYVNIYNRAPLSHIFILYENKAKITIFTEQNEKNKNEENPSNIHRMWSNNTSKTLALHSQHITEQK